MRKKKEIRDRIEHLNTCISIDKNFLKRAPDFKRTAEEIAECEENITKYEMEVGVLNWVLKIK